VQQHHIPDEWNPEVRLSYSVSFFCRVTNIEYKVQVTVSLKNLKFNFTLYL